MSQHRTKRHFFCSHIYKCTHLEHSPCSWCLQMCPGTSQWHIEGNGLPVTELGICRVSMRCKHQVHSLHSTLNTTRKQTREIREQHNANSPVPRPSRSLAAQKNQDTMPYPEYKWSTRFALSRQLFLKGTPCTHSPTLPRLRWTLCRKCNSRTTRRDRDKLVKIHKT